MRTKAQPVMTHGIVAGALLLETDDRGNETTWRAQSVLPHPNHLDHVLLRSGDESGRVRGAHISDWLRRVIER